MTGLAAVLVVLGVPVSYALFALGVAGIPLIIILAIPWLLAVVWLTRKFADLHRYAFTTVVGVTIARPYRPWEGRGLRSLWPNFRSAFTEAATWRDFLWLLVNAIVGLVAYVLVLSFFGSILWYASLPLLWAILEDTAGTDVAVNVLQSEFGLFRLDTQAEMFYGLGIAVPAAVLWWWLTPPIMRGYALLSRTLLGPAGSATLTARVQELSESRAETVDSQAAELRRIERDLHDGAQARLVSLGMSIGMAEAMMRSDPDAAAQLLAEARNDSTEALAELRALVRGMHPPVLADRGLVGAVEALALTVSVPVSVVNELPGRFPAPVESAAYFAIAESLTNVAKHAAATSARVRLGHVGDRLQLTVSDDGRGGAAVTSEGGLRGMQRRLNALDGTLEVTSPSGGPTLIIMEIPCELSSAKTTPSSGTG
jgi:signal transduction histidine kinase